VSGRSSSGSSRSSRSRAAGAATRRPRDSSSRTHPAPKDANPRERIAFRNAVRPHATKSNNRTLASSTRVRGTALSGEKKIARACIILLDTLQTLDYSRRRCARRKARVSLMVSEFETDYDSPTALPVRKNSQRDW
jgi:hypothetical protein